MSNSHPESTGSAPNPEHLRDASKEKTSDAERKRASDVIKRGLEQLGLDLPDFLVDKIAATYTGMLPLERYIEETLGLKSQQ